MEPPESRRGSVEQHVLREADRLARRPAILNPEDPDDAASIDLGLDTIFIRSCATDGPRHHKVLIGIGVDDRGQEAKIGGVLAAVDPPHRLVSDALRFLARGPATEVTTFTDGAKLLRQLLRKAGVKASPILDWQHIHRPAGAGHQAGRQGLARPDQRRAPGLPANHRDPRQPALAALAWSALGGEAPDGSSRTPAAALRHRSHPARTVAPARRLHTALGKLRDYADGQSAHFVNYCLRQRAGLPIGTSTTEALANTLVNRRMNKSQQMRWSVRGAHAVLVIRTAIGNGALAKPEAMAAAA